jgi:hypothetical protein
MSGAPGSRLTAAASSTVSAYAPLAARLARSSEQTTWRTPRWGRIWQTVLGDSARSTLAQHPWMSGSLVGLYSVVRLRWGLPGQAASGGRARSYSIDAGALLGVSVDAARQVCVRDTPYVALPSATRPRGEAAQRPPESPAPRARRRRRGRDLHRSSPTWRPGSEADQGGSRRWGFRSRLIPQDDAAAKLLAESASGGGRPGIKGATSRC